MEICLSRVLCSESEPQGVINAIIHIIIVIVIIITIIITIITSSH